MEQVQEVPESSGEEPTIAPEVERVDVPRGAGRDIPADPARRPSYVFLAVVSLLTLVSDVGTKIWAERTLDGYPGVLHVWDKGLLQFDFVLAKNRGGAWGLLQSTSENVRRPFFLLVSIAAIAFIVSLYRRLLHTQRALKWGLPLVLGGALGNVYDRIRYGHVIDFMDVHAVWKGAPHHWPTFNVADIAICVGVGLMAIDMFSAKKPRRMLLAAAPASPDVASPPVATEHAGELLATAAPEAQGFPASPALEELPAQAPPTGDGK
jgi:signal peptidase II